LRDLVGLIDARIEQLSGSADSAGAESASAETTDDAITANPQPEAEGTEEGDTNGD